MFCPECGAQITDNAQFCGECGAKIEGKAPEENVLPLPSEPNAQPAPADTEAANTPQSDSKQQRTRRNLLIVIAVLLALGIALIGVYIKQQADYKKAHATTDVTFTISAPGYVSGTDSKIPLHVEGTNFEGTAIAKDFYVSSDGTGLSLERGTYTITVIASPLLSNGTIYNTPSLNIVIVIDENGLQTDASQLTITFTVTDATSITDTQIDAAYNAARAGGMDETTATNLKDAVTKTRQDALDKKAANAATTKTSSSTSSSSSTASSGRHYSDNYVEFDMPEAWVGRVTGSPNGHTSGIWHSDFHLDKSMTYDILRIDGPSSTPAEAVGYVNSATEIWNQTHGKTTNASKSYLSSMIDLQTGGALSYDQVAAMSSESAATAAGKSAIDSYYRENIYPSMVFK